MVSTPPDSLKAASLKQPRLWNGGRNVNSKERGRGRSLQLPGARSRVRLQSAPLDDLLQYYETNVYFKTQVKYNCFSVTLVCLLPWNLHWYTLHFHRLKSLLWEESCCICQWKKYRGCKIGQKWLKLHWLPLTRLADFKEDWEVGSYKCERSVRNFRET